jgi:hypothetical protein
VNPKEMKSELDKHFSELRSNKPYAEDYAEHRPPVRHGGPRQGAHPAGAPCRVDGAALHQSRTPGSGASLDRIRKDVTPPHLPAITKCPNPIGIFTGFQNGKKITIPAPCKRWDCPTCGEQKKNIAADGIRDGSLRIMQDDTQPDCMRIIRFLTLTQHTDDNTPIMEAWARFRAYMAKKGIKPRFFGIKEHTKKGKLHLHILLNTPIPQRLISKAWKYATQGKSYIVHITRVSYKIGNPGAYMVKYLTKATHSRRFKKHEHRLFHDRRTDWKPYKGWQPPEGISWEFVYQPSPVKLSPEIQERTDRPPPDEGMQTPEGIPG